MPPFLSGALSSVGSSASGLLSVLGRLSGLLPVLNLVNGKFGDLTRTMASFAIVIGAVVGAVTKAIGELRNMGNAITDLRASTGMSAAGSGRLINSYNAQGLNGSQTAAAFGGMNVYESQARARAFGVSSFNDIPGLARGYQNTSPLLRNQLLGSADSPELRRILMQSPGALQGNANFQNRVQGGLGVDPSTIAKTSQQLALVTTRFRVLSETVLVRLGAEVLPRLLNVLEVVSNKLADRSTQIGEAISSGVDKGFKALVNVGTLISRLPEMFFAIADSVLTFASTAITAIPQVWDVFLAGISITQNALEKLWTSASDGFSHLLDISDTLGPAFLHLLDIIQFTADNIEAPFKAISSAISQFLKDLVNSVTGSKLGAYMQAYNAKSSVTDPLAKAARGAGVSPGWAEIIGNTAPGLLLTGGVSLAAKWGGRLLGLGGGAAAGAEGTAAATAGRAALFNPIGATVAGGLAVGGAAGLGWFRMMQEQGVNANKGFWETMGHGAGVAADFLTGNVGNTQRNYDQRFNRAANAPNSAYEKMMKAIGDSSSQFMAGVSNAPRGSWSKGYERDGFRGLGASMFSGFGNTPNSSWATALDQSVGGSSGLQASAAAAIQGLRGDLDKARAAYDGDKIRDGLSDLLDETKKQTGIMEKTDAQRAQAADNMDRVAGYALQRFGREQGAALRRAGN